MIQNTLKFKQRASLPMILQDEVAECGHACIAMISNYWGHQIDLLHLRQHFPTNARGVTLEYMHDILEHLGFTSRALRIDLEDLHDLRHPVILHWNMNHFVVLKRAKKKYAILHDPAVGVRRCSWTQMSQSFTGIVLDIEKNTSFTHIHEENKLRLSDFIFPVRHIKKNMLLLFSLSCILELFNLMNPLFLQYMSDQIHHAFDLRTLLTMAMGILILMSINTLTDYTRRRFILYLSTQLTEALTSHTVQHVLSLPLSFFERRHTGDLLSKFQSIHQIQQTISTDVINTMMDGLLVLVYSSILYLYSPRLTGIVILSLILQLLLRWGSYRTIKQETARSLHCHAKVSAFFLETFQAIRPLKAFLKEKVRHTMWRHLHINALNANIQVAKKNMRYQVMQQLLCNTEYLALLCLGAHGVMTNQLSMGMLMACLGYRLLLTNKASACIQKIFDYQLLSVAINRVSDLLLQKSEDTRAPVIANDSIQGAIQIKNLSFQYTPNSPFIIQGLNITIQAREKVAIVGASGCGKSTLLKIIMGLLPYTSGEICIDHRPMPSFHLKSYRQLFASVMQDDVLLSGSILENITFFHQAHDRTHVEHVARIANIHDTILQLPMGYDTPVGELGSQLSGGQKQRLLLARALYTNPKILILDEASSHLDAPNERQINHALARLNITQIIVAHREETINMADRVILLQSPDHGLTSL